MSENPKQPLIPPPPYPTAPQPPPYNPSYGGPPTSTTHTTVITAPPIVTATTIVIRPRTYLVWSLLTLILWCPLLGIFALIYSLKVDSEWAAGRYDEAQVASRMARNFNLIGLFCHVAVWVVCVIVIVSINAA